MALQIFGLLSGLIAGISYFPYIWDILKKSTKPERASWFIWSILGLVAFFSQLAKGATNSLWLTGVEVFFVFLIFLLSVKFGVGGLNTRDSAALFAASLGLILWYFTKEAATALIITILVDLTGTLLTVLKSFENPESETLLTWFLIGVSGILAMMAVGRFNVVLLLYPSYIACANLAVVLAIILGKRKKRKHFV